MYRNFTTCAASLAVMIVKTFGIVKTF